MLRFLPLVVRDVPEMMILGRDNRASARVEVEQHIGMGPNGSYCASPFLAALGFYGPHLIAGDDLADGLCGAIHLIEEMNRYTVSCVLPSYSKGAKGLRLLRTRS